MIDLTLIPINVTRIIQTLHNHNESAYLVGGSVRDLLLGYEPNDWDICTSALPKNVMALFDKAIPTGIEHGTITVILNSEKYEVTTLRSDGNYSDGRRPDSVTYTTSIHEDLARRDFTMNSMALDPITNTLFDTFNGQKDLHNKIIRTVGNPQDRFLEDGLRLFRAARFSSKLGFEIEEGTKQAIIECRDMLDKSSAERKRDELTKLLSGKYVLRGLDLLIETGLMYKFLPEIEACVGCEQNSYHSFDVWGHLKHAVVNAPQDKPLLRLAMLLHDIGKAKTRGINKRGEYSFLRHEVESTKIAKDFMTRMRFSNVDIKYVTHLIANHMKLFGSGFKEKSVRKFIHHIGKNFVGDMLLFRYADASGKHESGIDEKSLNALNRLKTMCAEQMDQTISSRADLALTSEEVMEIADVKPGPILGEIINQMVKYALVRPQDNTKEKMIKLLSGFKRNAEIKLADNNMDVRINGDNQRQLINITDYNKDKVIHQAKKLSKVNKKLKNANIIDIIYSPPEFIDFKVEWKHKNAIDRKRPEDN